jgi:hypothetical protein
VATSSIPGAIDYLYATVAALPQCAAPVVVSDGWPDLDGDVGVVIGLTPDDATTDDEVTHGQLGAQTQWETYSIPCVIWARAVGGARPMKTARDQAFAILNAIDSHLRIPTTGRTLGGVLQSGTAYAGNVTIRQTGDAAQAGEGRTCEIRFDVLCKSRSTA